jgi:hypothetical protein
MASIQVLNFAPDEVRGRNISRDVLFATITGEKVDQFVYCRIVLRCRICS